MAWFGTATSITKGTGSGLRPAPLAPVSLLGSLAPPDASATRSQATVEALAAAKRARKRAAGTLLTGAPVALSPAVPAVLTPKSLVGG